MDSSVQAALISLVVAILATLGTLFVTIWSQKLATKAEAKKVISKYRDPLISAANEMEQRISNLLDRNLEVIYILGNESQKEYVVESTVYVFAQFMAWREIIRDEVQFLDLGNDDNTKELNIVMNRIRFFMSTDSIGGKDFMVYSLQQRAIGDALIVDGRNFCSRCMSYAKFIQQKEMLDKHVDLIRNSVLSFVKEQGNHAGATVYRLRQVRDALIELMDLLDPKGHYRYDHARVVADPPGQYDNMIVRS